MAIAVIKHYSTIVHMVCPHCRRNIEELITIRIPEEKTYGCRECKTVLFRFFFNDLYGQYEYKLLY